MESKTYKFWRNDEIAFLKDEYPDVANKRLARKLGRTTQSVSRMARRLRLKKTKHYLANVHEGRIRPGEHKSPTTQYKKGKAA